MPAARRCLLGMSGSCEHRLTRAIFPRCMLIAFSIRIAASHVAQPEPVPGRRADAHPEWPPCTKKRSRSFWSAVSSACSCNLAERQHTAAAATLALLKPRGSPTPPRLATPAANCATTQNLLKCSRCHTAWFCGVKCQKVGAAPDAAGASTKPARAPARPPASCRSNPSRSAPTTLSHAGVLALSQNPMPAQRVCRHGRGAGAQVCSLDAAARQAGSAEG